MVVFALEVEEFRIVSTPSPCQTRAVQLMQPVSDNLNGRVVVSLAHANSRGLRADATVGPRGNKKSAAKATAAIGQGAKTSAINIVRAPSRCTTALLCPC